MWLFSVTASAHCDAGRREAKHEHHLDREADVEQQPPASPDRAPIDPLEESEELIGPWIEQQCAESARDTETLETIRYKARTGLTDEQIAAERGESVHALQMRQSRFKKKYAPLLRKHRERTRAFFFWLKLLGVGVGLAAIAVIVWLVWLRPQRAPQVIGPDPDTLPRGAPSASASASAAPPEAPPSFDQALPPLGPPASTKKL
jgi:hypothetical protein